MKIAVQLAKSLCVAYLALKPGTLHAGFISASPQVWDVVRGDKVELHVTAAAGADVLWFLDARKFAQGSDTIVSTGDFGPGEYSLYAAVFDEEATEIIQFRIRVSAPEVLYRPKTHVSQQKPVSAIRLPADTWWGAALRGRISAAAGGKGQAARSESGFMTLADGDGIEIGAGSDAVISHGVNSQQLLIRGRAGLRRSGDSLLLREGRLVWRRHSDDVVEISLYSEAKEKTPFLSGKRQGDVLIDLKPTPTGFDLRIMSVGGELALHCGGNRIHLSKEPGAKNIVFMADSGKCMMKEADSSKWRGELLSWARDFFPPWFGQRLTDFEQHLRLDTPKGEKPDPAAGLTTAEARLKEGQYLLALDVFASIGVPPEKEIQFYLMRGMTRLKLGLLSEAERDFRSALARSPSNGEAAKYLGDARREAKDFKGALRWYDTAQKWEIQNPQNVYRLQADTASKLNDPKRAAAYHYQAFWQESDESLARTDFANSRSAARGELFSARIVADGGVVSHVLPLNPEAYGDLPNAAVTNRSYAAAGKATWRRRMAAPVEAPQVFAQGEHTLFVPVTSTLSAGSKSDHLVGGGLSVTSGNFELINELGLGSILRGGERQVDQFVFKFGGSYSLDLLYSANLNFLRAYDPNPGGADIVDGRIDVVTPDGADHSHFDWGLELSVSNPDPFRSWIAKFAYNLIDFRRGILDEFDATEVVLGGNYALRPWRRLKSGIDLTYVQRSYKTIGSESLTTIMISSDFEINPNWDFGIYFDYFNRGSSEASLTYSGHKFGFRTVKRL